MGTGGSGVSGMETIVTMVVCALLGIEGGWNFLLVLSVILRIGPPHLTSSPRHWRTTDRKMIHVMV
jgi:hypothetical protein